MTQDPEENARGPAVLRGELSSTLLSLTHAYEGYLDTQRFKPDQRQAVARLAVHKGKGHRMPGRLVRSVRGGTRSHGVRWVKANSISGYRCHVCPIMADRTRLTLSVGLVCSP
jgi:hypothetical protein